MELIIESAELKNYLEEIPPIIKFDTPLVQEKISEIESKATFDKDKARIAFEIARDEIGHSFDTKRERVTINAEEVLKEGDGICFVKSHLMATLLRGMGIPTGFCYQRVLKDRKDPDSGHALHGLNAVYLKDTGWFRLDPRGNKLGINSQFSVEEEQLAYPIRKEYGEIDYPNVFTKPLKTVINSMKDSKNVDELFDKRPELI